MSEQKITAIVEKDLIKRAQRGEVAAFEELVRRHQTKILSFALNITGNRRELAQDMVQEALVHAHRYISSFRGDGSFSSWLWRILRNDFLRYLERVEDPDEISLEEPEALPDGNIPAVEQTVIDEERMGHFRALISRLSVDDQEVITLIHFEELSQEEAAQILGLSLEAFKSRLYRARGRIFELVKKNKNLFS